MPPGSACDDGESCTGPDTCDDGRDCTLDSCHPTLGCVHAYDARLPDTDTDCILGGSATYTTLIPKHKSARNIYLEVVYKTSVNLIVGPVIRLP